MYTFTSTFNSAISTQPRLTEAPCIRRIMHELYSFQKCTTLVSFKKRSRKEKYTYPENEIKEE